MAVWQRFFVEGGGERGGYRDSRGAAGQRLFEPVVVGEGDLYFETLVCVVIVDGVGGAGGAADPGVGIPVVA